MSRMGDNGAAGGSVEEEAEESFKRYIQPVRTIYYEGTV